MKFILFLILFSLSVIAYGLEPYQGKDVDVDKWRCGAPMVLALRADDPIGYLNDRAGKLKLKESLILISEANLAYKLKNLGKLTTQEQDLVDLIVDKFHAPIVHRTSLDVMQILLPKEWGLVSATKRGVSPKITPGIEQMLFGGADCIFAAVAPPYGIIEYGTVILNIKTKRSFAWGSLYTGWSWTKEVLGKSVFDPPSEAMKREFAKQIFTNDSFDEAIALQIIEHVRKGTSIRGRGKAYDKSTIIADLLNTSNPAHFWKKIVNHRLGFLEAHYTDDLGLDNFNYIQFRSMDMPTVKSWGLKSDWFTDTPSFIQHFDRDK